MTAKTKFNVTEKCKSTNIDETKKIIIKLVNNLIVKEFVNLQNNIIN